MGAADVDFFLAREVDVAFDFDFAAGRAVLAVVVFAVVLRADVLVDLFFVPLLAAALPFGDALVFAMRGSSFFLSNSRFSRHRVVLVSLNGVGRDIDVDCPRL